MPPVTIPQALDIALQQQKAGRLPEAETVYRQILAVQPHHAETHHLLGVIAHERGQEATAAEWIERAIRLGFDRAIAHSNLGEIYRVLGRLDEAVAACRRALQLQPELAAAHFNLGVVFSLLGRMAEGAAAFQRVTELEPQNVAAYRNLGVCLEKNGDLAGAITAYRAALRLQPDVAEVYFQLGVPLLRQGALEDAALAYRQATQLKPDYAHAHHNLALALLGLGEAAAAEEALQRALALDPNYVTAHYNLGNVWQDAGRLDEAEGAYRRALELSPRYASAHNNLGNLCKAQARLPEAIAAFRRAVEIEPTNANFQSNVILTLHYMEGATAGTIAEEQARWNRQIAEPLQAQIQPHRHARDPGRRLRIGYVSADFRDHTLGRNLRPLFAHHDHQSFEVVCYSDLRRPDELTANFRAHADLWRETVDLSDEELAGRIREDEVDILVDLALHSSGNRLPVFAREPAPVQVSFAGYPGSTGLRGIGYRISDRFLEEGVPAASHEQVCLIDSFWCYDPCGMAVPVNALPAGTAGHITFGSLNNFAKVNEGVLQLWARVLQAVRGSRLLLLSPAGAHRQWVLKVLRSGGVAEERVEFVAQQTRRKYLELYHRVDVMLETFPYNGHTTSLDALGMGVPVVSLAGEQIVARAGWSQLSNLGLPELVAWTADDYVRIAAELAQDLSRLESLRATLRGRLEASVLMDGGRFARGIERAYRAMWQRWCENGR